MSGSEDQGSGSARLDIERLDKLIAAAARGERGAFDQVFTQLSYPVYCMALALIRDQAHAEEVAQEVLTEIWQKGHHYDPGKSSAVAWALMITRRRAIDRIRSMTATANRERRNAVAAVSWDQVSETVQDVLDREQLRSCLDSLTDPHRQVIMLAFYGGYTYAEIALILDVAPGTVKSRVRAALIKLREAMRETE